MSPGSAGVFKRLRGYTAYRFIRGLTANPMCELGWKSLGVLGLTALPSIKE